MSGNTERRFRERSPWGGRDDDDDDDDDDMRREV